MEVPAFENPSIDVEALLGVNDKLAEPMLCAEPEIVLERPEMSLLLSWLDVIVVATAFSLEGIAGLSIAKGICKFNTSGNSSTTFEEIDEWYLWQSLHQLRLVVFFSKVF